MEAIVTRCELARAQTYFGDALDTLAYKRREKWVKTKRETRIFDLYSTAKEGKIGGRGERSTSCEERAAPVGSVFSSPIVAVASGLATMNP